MKEIMAKESSASDQGVSSFAYSLADKTMPFLFEFQRPLDDLAKLLTDSFAGQTLSMDEIYRKHSVGRPYLRKHYKDVLGKLEANMKISVIDPEGKMRKKGTFANRLSVTFPESGINKNLFGD